MRPARVAAALVLVGSVGGSIFAGGPRAVNGLGQPMKWNTAGPVSYNPDQGTLGLLTNAEAKTLVAEAFAVWADGPSDITFAEGASLAQNVNATGIPFTNPAHYQKFYRKPGDGTSPVIFDTDGSIIDAAFGEGARFEIIGIAGLDLDTPPGVATTITEASIIINGAFFDGVGLPSSPEDLTRTGLKAAIVHEIGHFINLDHTVLNHELAFDGNPGNDVYVPTMFPIAVDDEDALATTNPDDQLAALNLYPVGAPANSLSGSVRASGMSYLRGANVVFRKISDPLMNAYSIISGGLWFPCNAGSACDPCNTACDPGNPVAKGAFSADYFDPGGYTVCVEQIDTRFSNASFVGPLPTPAILSGPEECFNTGDAPSENDDPDDATTVTAGSATPIDIVLNPIPSSDPLGFEPNNTLETGSTLIDLPGGRDSVHGLLGAGDLDVFNVPVVAGQRVRVDIDAKELGSPLDAVLGFYDASSNLVAVVDDANDPDSSGYSLDPALELVASFTGTAKVVVSSYPDTDLNGVGGVTTGGYWIRVEVATDTDGDGAPDGEDICPASARDDADRDGVCFEADNCPTYDDRWEIGLVQLNGSLVASGDVLGWVTSPDGSRVVYMADQATDTMNEIYSVPISGGAATKLNLGLAIGGDVLGSGGYKISPNSARVVYVANQGGVTPFELYSVPIGGGASTKLNGTMVAQGDVEIDFIFSPDSSRVVYRADQTTNDVIELYSVPIGGGTPVKLNGSLVAGGDVDDMFKVSPDGSRVVYAADQNADEIFELYSVPIAGGTPTKLNGTLVAGGDVVSSPVDHPILVNLISPNSSTVVYTADQDTDEVFEQYSVPIGGGTPTKLNGGLVAGGDVASQQAPIAFDGSRVIYGADQDADEVFEMYSVPIGGGTATKINGPLATGGDIFDWFLAFDSSTMLYTADQDADDVIELYRVPIGGGTSTKLNGPLVAGGDVSYSVMAGRRWLTPDGQRVVYAADQDTDETVELYSVPIGGGAPTKLNRPLVSGGDVTGFDLSFDGSRVVYRADQDTDETFELYGVPVEGGSVTKLSGPLSTGGDVFFILGSPVSPTDSIVVYRADQDLDEVLELYSVDMIAGSDSDSDGILNGCDICPAAANPGQADADGNGVGDACQACAVGTDLDADGVCGATDNCPDVANVSQADFDVDGAGNACDGDDDNDGLQDTVETDTETYVGPANTGSDPLDADSDDDGVSDGNEVAGGTDPNVSTSVSPGTPFHAGRVITAAADLAVSVFAADVDGDGDTDVLSASYLDDKIAWYENDGASPPVWTPRTISIAANNAVSVFAADLDGDGDTDVLSASFNDDKIAWYESNGASPPSWTPRTISSTADGAYSVFAVDLDRDGDTDVLSASYNDDKIAWYENNGAAPPVWTPHDISTSADGARSIVAADVDGDGDTDVLSASYNDDKIAWYESDGAAVPSFTPRTISTAADSAVSVFAADVDGDGDIDALSASYDDDKIAWYENNGASPPAWTARTISTAADGAYSVFGADVDGDGDTDVLSASINDNKIALYENNGASPPVWAARVLSTSASGGRSVFAADVDADGDNEVLSASEADDTIRWYENRTIHRSAAFPARNTISGAVGGAVSVDAGDIDGDGDIDTIHGDGQSNTIRWFASNGANPPSWTPQTIGSTPTGLEEANLCDLDRDGDLDVLYASFAVDDIGWVENGGGASPIWTFRTISTTQDSPAFVTAADIDGDGDPDVVASSRTDSTLAWYRNDGGVPLAFTKFVITTAPQYERGLATADMDRDGDIDIVAAVPNLGRVVWFENGGGPTPSWTEAMVSNPPISVTNFVDVGDINGDGDPDVVSASYNGNDIAWFESDGAADPVWTTHSIVTAVVLWTFVSATDMDRDGDIDIVATSGPNGFVWLENDGNDPPAWTMRTIPTNGDGVWAFTPADLDADGDLDFVAGVLTQGSGHEHEWFENRGGQFSLATTSLAPATMGNGATQPMLAIDFTSNARAGDRSVELATLELLVADSGGVSLSSEEANRLIERVRVYLDNGSSVLELGSDTLVATVDDLALSPLVIPFANGDPRVRLTPGQSKRLFVVVETTLDASAQTPNAFKITHATQGGSTARDAATGALLQLQYASNVVTPTITTIGDVSAPFVTSVFPPGGSVDVAAYTDVIVSMSEPVDPATADLGVTLSIGGAKVVGHANVSDDGRIVTFDPDGPLTLGGNFTLTVSGALKDRSGVGATPFVSVFEATSSASSGSIAAATLGNASGGSVLEGANANDNSGFSAAALADVNATMVSQGISDLIVGAPNADAGAVDAGEARLVFGAPGLQSSSGTAVGVAYRTAVAGDFIGDTVSRAGDMDSDGIQDFLIGAPRSDQSASDAGVVYLIFGDPGIDELAPGPLSLGNLAACASATLCGVKFLGEGSGDQAGASLSYAGDVNADGFDDILIGAPGADPAGRADAGKVYLIYGPLAPGTIALSSVGSTTRGLVFRGETAGDRVGTSVSQWQDRNSDGIDDLLLGAPGATALNEFGTPIASSGYVYAIQGGTLPGRLDDNATPGVIELSRVANGGSDQVAGMVFLGSEPNGEIGRSLTGAIDTDGNGTYDILLAGDGMAFAIPGDGPKIIIGSTETGGRGTSIVGGLARAFGVLNVIADFGAKRYLAGDTDPLTVGPAGDLNRDGFGDFMIGAPQADGTAGANAGKAYAILGTPAPAEVDLSLADVGNTIAGFVVEGAAAGDNLGASVGGGFDLNADGIDDGLIGAPFADTDPVTPVNAGETYVISPIRPDEVTLLTFQDLGGTSARIEWPVPDLAATYNLYRGLLSGVRSGGGVHTSAMTQLACGVNADSDADQLPDFLDAAAPSVGDAFVYLVTARNSLGESPIGTSRPARVNDAQCP